MAMRGINKAIIIGNLGSDPEVRYMPSGGAVTNLSVATNESWKDKQSGETKERTEWHRVVFFNRLAEIARDYLKKGSKIYIEGRIQTRKWQDQNNNDRYTTEIIGNELQMLDSRGGSSDGGSFAPPQGQGASNFAPASQQQRASNPAPAAASSGGSDDFDDDIPF